VAALLHYREFFVVAAAAVVVVAAVRIDIADYYNFADYLKT